MYLKSGKSPKNSEAMSRYADIVDWDLKPHLNMCTLNWRFFILVAICMNLKPFVFWDFFLCFYFIIIKLNFLPRIRWLI